MSDSSAQINLHQIISVNFTAISSTPQFLHSKDKNNVDVAMMYYIFIENQLVVYL